MTTLRQAYADNTRRALMDAGLSLFSERPYADVSAEELVGSAGLTRGALYHHFNGKQGLFEAIFNDLERQAADRISQAIEATTDPFDRVNRGVSEFFAICTEPTYQHIAMLQGPIALGWDRWRELDLQHLGGVILEAIERLDREGLIKPPHPTRLVARAFFGLLAELSMAIAESEDPRETQRNAEGIVRDLLSGLQ